MQEFSVTTTPGFQLPKLLSDMATIKHFDVYKKICPAYLQDVSDLHKTESYVYSQMIAGIDAAHFEAKNSWLTGTAAWTIHQHFTVHSWNTA